MQDISGRPEAGQQLINSYGDGGFRVSGIRYEGSVLIMPESTEAWPLTSIEDMNVDSFEPLRTEEANVEILLLGCGENMAFVDVDIRASLKAHGIVIDAMDTGAAVRTYNVLLLEGRHVAAALIAV